MTSSVYERRYSNRAKRLSITVGHDYKVVVTIPRQVSDRLADKFILQKSSWIEDKVLEFKSRRKVSYPFNGKRAYLKYKEYSRKILSNRALNLAEEFGFRFGKISIRDQKTRWGSCSVKGNLNFNYKLAFLPDRLRDYIIIHELCHLRHLNHGKNFWKLVERFTPNYRECEKELKSSFKI